MHHGSKTFEVTAPRSRFYQGGFGRLFPDLQPWAPDLTPFRAGGVSDTQALELYCMDATARLMVEPAPAGAAADSTLPSGYVYFGQFVDHDLTLDVTPLSDAEIDPNRLHNFRTPRLDLDCLYGLGPDAQPHLYEHKDGIGFTGKLIVAALQPGEFEKFPDGFDSLPVEFADLPRNSEDRALIGDPRNDENALVAQIHLAFLLAHNRLVDRARHVLGDDTPGGVLFLTARKILRRLYQWIVLKDYLRRLVLPEIYQSALKLEQQDDGRQIWKLGYKDDVFNWKKQPFMPVEFSVAAYRFGHSLVRNGYQTNSGPVAGFGTFFAIFDETGRSVLQGGKRLTLQSLVQWDWFLAMTSSGGPFPPVARRFDTRLAKALTHLPEDNSAPGSAAKILNVLAARNLKRGIQMELPSGPDVARLFGLEPVPLQDDEPQTLWYYILKEADQAGPNGGNGNALGTVGSILVAATFAGLLKGDPLSWLNQEPLWTPDSEPLLTGVDADGNPIDFRDDVGDANIDAKDDENVVIPLLNWGLPSIIRLSKLPVDATLLDRIAAAPAAAAPVAPPPAAPE